jgi:Leucine-rich repeat (LRR) protein
MKEFIKSLNRKYDVKIPLCAEPQKGQNSYSLDKFGNIDALFLNNLDMQNLDFLLPIAEKLEVLSLNNCSIKQISSANSFFSLKKLSLVDNPLEQSELDQLIQLKNLIELNLNITKITDSSPLCELTKLRQLDLGFNSYMYEVKGLKKLNSLNHLDLQFSRIDSLSKVEVNENIQSMNFNGSQLTKISNLENYSNLRNLELSGSRISKIEGLTHSKNLRRLSLAANSINKIDGLGDLVNLETLDLSMNEIPKMEGMEYLINLKGLNLRDNKISVIENLNNLHNLETLILDDNKIRDFDSTFLNNLNSPCIISLAGNPLKQFEGSIPNNVIIEFETEHRAPRFL